MTDLSYVTISRQNVINKEFLRLQIEDRTSWSLRRVRKVVALKERAKCTKAEKKIAKYVGCIISV